MKFKYIGDVEAVQLDLGQRIKPGDVLEVPDNLVERFDNDVLFEKEGAKASPKSGAKSSAKKEIKGDE